jgi:uncharacterized protein (DUF2336 family)
MHELDRPFDDRSMAGFDALSSLAVELEDAIASSDVRRRAVMLRRVADLFVASVRPTARETTLFDDVMERLVAEVETSARTQLSEYLAGGFGVATKTIRRLASDDIIEVARPVLTHSEQLDLRTLEEVAGTKSQAHLKAISDRESIPEPVTDLLVERGDRDVVLCIARNPGARFSAFGFSSLVQRSSEDEELTVATWIRSDVPRRHLLKLFADASSTVRDRLSKEEPTKTKVIAEVVTRAMDRLQTRTRKCSSEFLSASALVGLLEEAGRLDEEALLEFAKLKKFSEAVLSLSAICDVPSGVIERALVGEKWEQILVLAKAAALRWDTTRALLVLQGTSDERRGDLERLFETFLRMRPETARKAVQFYRLRERALVSSEPSNR